MITIGNKNASVVWMLLVYLRRKTRGTKKGQKKIGEEKKMLKIFMELSWHFFFASLYSLLFSFLFYLINFCFGIQSLIVRIEDHNKKCQIIFLYSCLVNIN